MKIHHCYVKYQEYVVILIITNIKSDDKKNNNQFINQKISQYLILIKELKFLTTMQSLFKTNLLLRIPHRYFIIQKPFYCVKVISSS